MNKIFSKVAVLSVGLTMAIGVGVAVGSKGARVARAAEPDTNKYQKITAVSGLSAGDKAVLYNAIDNEGVTGTSGSKDASVASSGWLEYTVAKTASGFTLEASSGSYVTLGTKSFSHSSTATDLSVTSNGYLCKVANNDDILYHQSTFVRNYTGKSSDNNYHPFAVYKVLNSEPADVLESITVTGSMSKTAYYVGESWSPAGLVATGHYQTAGNKDISNKVTWTYSPASPALNVTSVVATATLGTVSGNSSAQAVTVTEAPANPGTEDNPYTVAQARAAIDAGSGTSNVYATGIVSAIVTVYSTQYKNVSFNISVDGTTGAAQLQAYREKSSYSSTVKVGDIVVVRGNLTKYSSTYEFAANCAITSLKEPSGTKYSVIDRVDYGSLDKDEVIEGSTLAAKIVPETGYWYPESVTVLMGGSPATYSYVNGVVTIENVTGNVSIEGTCSSCNPIKSLYAKLVGSPVEINGYFVGAVNDGIFLMDGEYGIFVYQGSLPEGAIVNETKLHVSGTIAVFGNTLYQIAAGATITINASAEVATPINYTLTGSESSSDLSTASRRLLEKGAISAITRDGTTYEPSYTGDVPTVDTSKDVFLTINGIQVIYKKTDVTQAVFNVLFEYLLNGKNVFVEAFTSFYNENFQLRFSSVVEATEGYTAEMFASDLLEKTDAVCEDYDGVTDNKAALAAVWLELQEKVLSDEEIDRFNDNENDFSSARARYDYLVGKYGLTDFLQRNPDPIPSGAYTALSIEGNPTIFIVVAIATASTLAFSLLLVFKKRKHN